MAEQTPIPAEALEAAAKVALRRYESEYSVAPNVTWRDFVPEVRELVEAVAPILLAAGRTAAAEDIRAAGVEEAKRTRATCCAHCAYAVESWADRAARVAENGADR